VQLAEEAQLLLRDAPLLLGSAEVEREAIANLHGGDSPCLSTEALQTRDSASWALGVARYVHPVPDFKLNPAYAPTADQPQAIAGLAEGLRAGERFQTLLGATGTGKTFTMAGVIEAVQRPSLVIAHNKTLAAQLCNEFREFFPDNAVEYFVSYYDYYQPEAYVPAQDLYIEKDSSINDEIDRLRHAATAALFARRDVIIVASVSCIYGIGSPQVYNEKMQLFKVGEQIDRDEVLRKLVKMQYQRNDSVLGRGTFRVRGEVLEMMPSYAESAYRVALFGDEIEAVQHFDPLTGEILDEIDHVSVWPASHYVTKDETLERAVEEIRAELETRTAELEAEGKQLEAHRLRQRTAYDIEMLKELGFTSGIENYSRILDGRPPGSPPHVLIDYFPDDFVCFVDESHQTIPQIGGMYEGDRSRKQTLVDYGFRLPSAIDNRPLKFEEFLERVPQLVLASATPGPFERAESARFVEQIVRPTGIVDPEIEVRETRNQIDDLMNEIKARAEAGERVLVTTLTKKMAEDLTAYLLEYGIRVRYLHSEVDTLERIQIVRDLRLGEYDVLVGVNLLREGLDLPEVSLVAILDADKEGFLRGETSLVQTIGRAARNVNGRVLMYADRETKAMRAAIRETDRRRAIQLAYNEEHGITPETVRKGISEMAEFLAMEDRAPRRRRGRAQAITDPAELERAIVSLEEEMLAAADNLRFEEAARIRDELKELRRDLDGMTAGA
jgi:excinuclease ABC subunit B